jgi:hypothetical protein
LKLKDGFDVENRIEELKIELEMKLINGEEYWFTGLYW